MSWFKGLRPDSLRDAFVHELKAAYDMEEQQVKALENFESSATDTELKALFNRHRAETHEQIARLDRIFAQLGLECESDTNPAARGAAKEAKVASNMGGDDAVRDATLIMAAQGAEHLEIAFYGTLRTWARILGEESVASVLERSLEEERAFDRLLSEVAESAINEQAAH